MSPLFTEILDIFSWLVNMKLEFVFEVKANPS